MELPRQLLPFLLVLCGLTGTPALEEQRDKASTQIHADASVLTDQILDGLRIYLPEHGLQSIPLPDVAENFTFPIGLFSLSGNINMTNGILRNIEQMKRIDDTQMTYLVISSDNPQKGVSLLGAVELNNVEAEFNCDLKVGAIKSSGKMTGYVSGTRIEFNVILILETLQLNILELKVRSVGSIKVKFNSGIFGYVSSLVTNLAIKFMDRDIKEGIEKEIPPQIQAYFDSLDIAGALHPPVDLT